MHERQGKTDLEQTVKALRQTLKDRALRISSQTAEISKLKQRLTFYEKRDYGTEIEPLRHNTIESMNRFFATVEDTSPYIDFGQALKLVLEKHRVSLNGKSILDWGVGPGLALMEIIGSSQTKSVTGFDTSEVALEHARSIIPQGRFESKDIYEATEERFDVVICVEVLEHLDDPESALHNLYRSTADQGALVVTVPDGRIDYSRLHINFWSPESWTNFVTKALPNAVGRFGSFRVYQERAIRNNYVIITR